MPEATVTTRPAWVDELVTRLGEPEIDCTEPIEFLDRVRQVWVWRIGGKLLRFRLDRTAIPGRLFVAAALVAEAGRRAELICQDEPTDDEMRALVALAWPEAAAR